MSEMPSAVCLAPDPGLELWAGPECTVNRVGDRFVDQLELSGHATREADLELLAWLGVKAARYPVLWERTAPDGLTEARWEWPDRRMARLRELGIRPVVGLLHHGSGPADTSLVDPAFPAKLAAYARAVAERYPWARDWTPINEPLTTARFSALYGVWYPHERSFPAFVRAVLNQCVATILAMAEIRRVVPDARLVQTEDFGRMSSTAPLAWRARMDAALRSLSLDLLTGLVTPEHPLWPDLLAAGATQDELTLIAEAGCAPDVVGLNHYVTSDRFLDDRLARYPEALHGGDGHRRYADVESVRVGESAASGHAALLASAWARYGRPLAITEVHLACTRDEQVRWFAEAWNGARRARDEGVDVQAVTAWSLVGSFGWERLVTDANGRYEPGLFDLRAPAPRPTAVAHAVRRLARGEAYDSAALDAPGWWRRPQRVLFPAAPPASPPPQGRALLVTGASGTLGRALARAAEHRGLRTMLVSRRELDIADERAVNAWIERVRPWAVVNAAGYVRVDDAERDGERCWRDNVTGAVVLARAAAAQKIRLATFSSDLVFNGRADAPYDETAAPCPLNVYGASKAVAEARVLSAMPQALIVRTAAFFGSAEAHDFVAATLRALAANRPVHAACDLRVSPTYVPDLAEAVLDLLFDEVEGLWHVVNRGAVTWSELAHLAAVRAGLEHAAHLIRPTPAAALGLRAARPANCALASARGQTLGSLEEALDRFVEAAGLQVDRPGGALVVA
jgi:dTDP-4-dehydrorhamnose reductase